MTSIGKVSSYVHPREFIADDNIDLTSEEIFTLPKIILIVEGQKLLTLVDTGAETSLINEGKVMEKLALFENKILPIKSLNLITANSRKITTINQMLVAKVQLGNVERLEGLMIMRNLKIDCLIGMDLLTKFKVKINIEEKSLEVGGEKIFWKMSTEDKVVANINFRQNLEINKSNKNQFNIDCEKKYQDEIRQMLNKHQTLFNEESKVAKGYAHKLNIVNEASFKCKIYPIPHAYKEQVWKAIEEMIKDGIVERASTNFVSPLIVVRKRDNSIRLCLDARKINQLTNPQFEAPQNIDSLLGKIGNNTIFTKLDLKNSFWLIPLSEESRKYTGFSIDGNTFQFKVVPFGLSTSLSALVRVMQIILGKYEEFCVHYVDDILVFSKNDEEHKRHIKIILEKLEETGLKLNIEKCQFLKKEVKYLGYIINKVGISVDVARLEEVKNYPAPKNLRTLRGFLGVMNYYKKFIPEYSDKTVAI